MTGVLFGIRRQSESEKLGNVDVWYRQHYDNSDT